MCCAMDRVGLHATLAFNLDPISKLAVIAVFVQFLSALVQKADAFWGQFIFNVRVDIAFRLPDNFPIPKPETRFVIVPGNHQTRRIDKPMLVNLGLMHNEGHQLACVERRNNVCTCLTHCFE